MYQNIITINVMYRYSNEEFESDRVNLVHVPLLIPTRKAPQSPQTQCPIPPGDHLGARHSPLLQEMEKNPGECKPAHGNAACAARGFPPTPWLSTAVATSQPVLDQLRLRVARGSSGARTSTAIPSNRFAPVKGQDRRRQHDTYRNRLKVSQFGNGEI